jgi:hypothetical protein
MPSLSLSLSLSLSCISLSLSKERQQLGNLGYNSMAKATKLLLSMSEEGGMASNLSDYLVYFIPSLSLSLSPQTE